MSRASTACQLMWPRIRRGTVFTMSVQRNRVDEVVRPWKQCRTVADSALSDEYERRVTTDVNHSDAVRFALADQLRTADARTAHVSGNLRCREQADAAGRSGTFLIWVGLQGHVD